MGKVGLADRTPSLDGEGDKALKPPKVLALL